MAKDVVIRISAQDAASPVFKRLSGEAAAMGASVEQSAQKSSRSFDDFNRKAALMGAAIGSATLVLGQFAQKAAEEEVVFARLRQSIEATGKSYDDYADRVNQVIAQGEGLSFADDQVADALARLTTQTGDAQVALDQMGLAMDVARARNISLGTAAELVGKVHEGNIGILNRYGIAVEEGATATEALAVLQQRTAGQAEAYADTTQGAIDRAKNSFDNLTESIGAHTGGMQELLLILPGLTAGYAALSGAIAGVGATLLKFGGPLALLAGATYLTQDQLRNGGNAGGSTSSGLFGRFAAGGADLFQTITPGSYGDALFEDIKQQYLSVINSENFEDAALSVLVAPMEKGGTESLYNRLAYLLQVAPGQYSPQELQALAEQRATAGGYQSTGQYLLATASTDPNLIQTPSGAFIPKHVYYEQLRQDALARSNAIAATATSYVGAPGTSGLASATGVNLTPSRYYGDTTTTDYTGPLQPAPVTGGAQMGAAMGSNLRAGPMANAGDLATFDTALGSLEAYREALRAGRVELELLNGAQMNAADAQLTFKVSQDTLIESQEQYTGQLSEYQTQLGYIDSAVDILNQRRKAGIALSAEEQTFLDNAASGQERLQGGIEDATVALGMQALQYAENMKIGDALNASMDGVGDSVDNLTESVNALIEALGGVPPNTDANVTTNAPEATEAIHATGAAATSLDGTNATVSIFADDAPFWSSVSGLTGRVLGTSYIQIAAAPNATIGGGGMHGLTAMAHGGTAYDPLHFANGGTYALVGEVGPELVKLSRGDQVMPAPGTRSVLSRNQGVGNISIQTLNLYPETGDVRREITAAVVRDWR